MEKFTPVLAGTITEPGKPVSLTGALEKGESAFAVKVNMASGVAGFVNVGHRVDDHWTGAATSGTSAAGGEMTRLIAGNVRVVGVDQTSDARQITEGIARTVTLAASREEVALLTQAAATGRLNPSLVGAQSEAPARIEVDMMSLLGLQPEEAATAPRQDLHDPPPQRRRSLARTDCSPIPRFSPCGCCFKNGPQGFVY